MVIILAGFVSVILLRMLKKDYARYDKEESLGDLVFIYFSLFFFYKTYLNHFLVGS